MLQKLALAATLLGILALAEDRCYSDHSCKKRNEECYKPCWCTCIRKHLRNKRGQCIKDKDWCDSDQECKKGETCGHPGRPGTDDWSPTFRCFTTRPGKPYVVPHGSSYKIIKNIPNPPCFSWPCETKKPEK